MNQHLPVGTSLLEYRLIKVLGEGGFGVTYLAEDAIGIRLAIKEYLPVEFAVRDVDSRVVARSESAMPNFAWGLERFQQEAARLVRFRGHPNIVRIERFFPANGTAYLVMPYEDGESLTAAVNRDGPPPPAALERIVQGLLAGLSAVHDEGMLHRDIKPDNVYLRVDGSPVLLDFGAAREAIRHRSRMLTGLVSEGYSPPEQYDPDGGAHGPWSDLYALAATLYFAMSGISPPPSGRRGRNDPLRPVAEVVRHSHAAGLCAAVDASLALDPEERPRSVADFRRIVGAPPPPENAAATRKVESSFPPSPVSRPALASDVDAEPDSWSRRIKGIGAVVVIVLVASLVIPKLVPHRQAIAVDRLFPGDSFAECTICPTMVVVPEGDFTMGASKAEVTQASRRGWAGVNDEIPRHAVIIARRFAIGMHEISNEQYRVHLKGSGRNPDGCHDGNGHRVHSGGWLSRDDIYYDSSPAACVSRDDAWAYVRWLNQRLFGTPDGPYRLPSEAEWEYAARAGSTTQFPWGDTLGSGHAHCRECGPVSTVDGRVTGPASRGSYPANAFGLFDMIGNLGEFVADCDTPNYVGAPADGRAVTGPGECGGVIRGGDFDGDAFSMRSASRIAAKASDRYIHVGFRVARDLEWRPR
ncbi:bifunctional serine/threonine-protein kinase/formylglycine-generating enzyme family protein [Magnetospirillum sp. SS-4]|uniref:bifunctional serine/threonine-protein kinase/formylglycine-generating enzyme family protein n=1 Tax=Magnetospirillum sp. SS-4 TaxID=2681465 RepID=UPI0013800AA4|nr:bifunctional serine/threonine-protein kinase/formylglycine-generating enzyme family protein [Magnetospirillum sp. SS-4]CAA7617152.1 putative Serine/threonine protein kinase [Magnetospirillum sp. SS-4]